MRSLSPRTHLLAWGCGARPRAEEARCGVAAAGAWRGGDGKAEPRVAEQGRRSREGGGPGNRAGIRGGPVSGRRADKVGRTAGRWSFSLSRSGKQGPGAVLQGLRARLERRGGLQRLRRRAAAVRCAGSSTPAATGACGGGARPRPPLLRARRAAARRAAAARCASVAAGACGGGARPRPLPLCSFPFLCAAPFPLRGSLSPARWPGRWARPPCRRRLPRRDVLPVHDAACSTS
jgi:hypothetical protein